MSSGHNKNKGFSQTSKRYSGDIKAQRQQAHNHQLNPKHESAPEEVSVEKNPSSSSSPSKSSKA